MILVIGGAFQGKGSFAAQLAEADRERPGHPVLCNVHERIKAWLEEHPDAGQEEIRRMAEKLAEENPDSIVTMDEVGYGIVPISEKERQYREAVGWSGQVLAAQAETVYRIVAGIPVKIKQEMK